MNRRTLLRWLISTAAAVKSAVRPTVGARAGQELTFPAAEQDTLQAIGTAVLPAELGPKGTAEVVDRFVRWVHNYAADAEMDHGYGTTRLRRTGIAPLPAYLVHLRQLEHSAAAKGHTFSRLDPATRRRLVDASIMASGVDTLPPRPDGRHVAADLMSFFFHSSEANDLCYRAAIGRDTCRGLPGSGTAPEQLDVGA